MEGVGEAQRSCPPICAGGCEEEKGLTCRWMQRRRRRWSSVAKEPSENVEGRWWWKRREEKRRVKMAVVRSEVTEHLNRVFF